MKKFSLLILPILLLSFTNVISQSATAFYESGVENYQKENYRGALKDLDRAIELNPNYTDAFFARGNVYFGRFNQNLVRAKEDYTKAIELDPQLAKGFYNRGLANSGLEKYTEAIEDFTKAIEIEPNSTKAYQRRAEAKKLNGDREGAVLDFEVALELEMQNSKPVSKVPANDEIPTKADSTKTAQTATIVANNPNTVYVNLEAFAPVEKEINFAGQQLLNARRTFVVGFLLNIAGGLLMASTALTSDPKTQLGLGIAGGITTTIGGIVMLTAVIPIGGAGKALKKVRFPKQVKVDLK